MIETTLKAPTVTTTLDTNELVKNAALGAAIYVGFHGVNFAGRKVREVRERRQARKEALLTAVNPES